MPTHPHTNKSIGKTVLIRPGALGDVLVAMPTLSLLKKLLNGHPLILIAPSTRAKLLTRDPWADLAYDWDSAIFTTLFHPQSPNDPETNPPPERLKHIFNDANLIVSLAGCNNSSKDAAFIAALRRLSPNALICSVPFHPNNSTSSVRLALYDAVASFCEENNLLPAGLAHAKRHECDAANLIVHDNPPKELCKPYLVIHPGSGSKRKNWPEERFLALADMLLTITVKGNPVFRQLIVTAGEADGRLGEKIVQNIPSAALFRNPDLNALATILAHASMYVGNDSGVSHLAASVATPEQQRPLTVTLFGPTDKVVWGPKDAFVLQAGSGMLGLEAEDAYTEIYGLMTEFLLER